MYALRGVVYGFSNQGCATALQERLQDNLVSQLNRSRSIFQQLLLFPGAEDAIRSVSSCSIDDK